MVLLDVVGKFKNFFSISHDIVLDDVWDQLNRSFMFLLLIICGAVTVVRQHAGNIIVCDGFVKFGGGFVEDYCWTQGLYTIREAYDKPYANIPYPGIIPEDVPPCMEVELNSGGRIVCPDPSEIKAPQRAYHLWYQWVPFYFWISAGAFYLPYLLFKFLGFEELKAIVRLVHNPLLDDAEMEKTLQKATTWLYYRFVIYMNAVGWNAWIQRHKLGLVILFTKVLYLVLSVMVFWLTAEMFEIGNYITYGEEWALSLPKGANVSTLVKDKLFPKMVACEIKRWGTTGLEQERGMCVIAPNVINQYLFLIEWFCLVFTIACNVFSVVFAVVKLLFVYATYRKLLATAFLQGNKTIKRLYHKVGTTGRITLHILGSNVRPRIFEEIITHLAERLQKDKILDKKPNDNRNVDADTLPLKKNDSQV